MGFFVGFCPTFVGIGPVLFAFIPVGGHRQALAAIRKTIEIQELIRVWQFGVTGAKLVAAW